MRVTAGAGITLVALVVVTVVGAGVGGFGSWTSDRNSVVSYVLSLQNVGMNLANLFFIRNTRDQ